MRIEAKNIYKHFNSRVVLKNVHFEVHSGESLVITGPNGSGKTTLIRIICGLISPNKGELHFYNEKEEIPAEDRYQYIGLVGPYLQLYNQLTAWENIEFFSKIRGIKRETAYYLNLMERLGLRGREEDVLKTYSSGMQQRMKYVIALLHEPEILILDEPTANLDEKGSRIVYEIMQEQMASKLLILATNEPNEVKFGKKRLQVNWK